MPKSVTPPPADGFYQRWKLEVFMRKPLSKKVRFEVFKRDGFTCAYCGATPPKVILQVDHIVPVSGGGNNSIDNLVTSCQPCNIGKGKNSLTSIPESLQEKALRIKEQEEQLQGFYKILKERDDGIESELWEVAQMIEPMALEKGIPRDWAKSIRYFLEQLGLYDAKYAAEIARAKFPYGGKKTFLYFCGVCHRKIRGE